MGDIALNALCKALLEIGEMVIFAFIGLVGLGPASRVFTFHLLDSLLTATTKISICPHMTSYSNRHGTNVASIGSQLHIPDGGSVTES
jgi:hypothetical protein